LEGTFQAALDADHPGVKNNGTAANTVLTRSFIEADYSLAALDYAFDYPIDRPAIKDFRRALGPHSRDVARQAV
jgi:hypothetical protein